MVAEVEGEVFTVAITARPRLRLRLAAVQISEGGPL